ncbi:imelysin family protein [Pseudoroseomonas globiformis]|uniref:Imelysin family protein n=1 Tax=Teichococcus globiformis TaxID=2307229 RepID=A0ABV7G6P6_9PROT
MRIAPPLALWTLFAMRLSRRAALTIPALLLPGRGALAAAPDDAALRALNRAVVEQGVLPGYRRFTSATANLTARLDALARDPTEPGPLAAAREGFADTMLAWQSVQHIRFGPADLFSRHARVQFWPDPEDRVGQDLARAIATRDTTVLEARPQALGHVTTRGLPALERLLFGEGAAAGLAAGDAGAGYRAALLRTIGGNLATLGRDLLAGWTGGETPQAAAMTEPRAPYATPRDATLDLLRALHAALEAVAGPKLAPALRNSAAAADPQQLECWRSRLSGQAIRVNVEAIRAMTTGMLPALEAAGAGELVLRLRQSLDLLDAGTAAFHLPLEEAIGDEARRAAPLQARDEAASLRLLLAQRLVPALGLPASTSLTEDGGIAAPPAPPR